MLLAAQSIVRAVAMWLKPACSPCVLCIQQLGHLHRLPVSRHGIAHAQQEGPVHAVYQVGAKGKHIAKAAQLCELNTCSSANTWVSGRAAARAGAFDDVWVQGAVVQQLYLSLPYGN